ncbi:MAG: tetratricopeptide repeat protein [Candidatus Aureabacteria bacterium]|nr:tetratricopeptide repeat protein [Candidatus Auribacterota bacterium]
MKRIFFVLFFMFFLIPALADEQEEFELFNKGLDFFNQGKDDEAAECFNKVLEINPQNKFTLEMMAKMYFGQLKQEESLVYWNKIAEYYPDDFNAWYYKAFIEAMLKKYEEAEKSYEKLASICPEDNRFNKTFVEIGHFYMKILGNYENALGYYKKALEIGFSEKKLSEYILSCETALNILRGENLPPADFQFQPVDKIHQGSPGGSSLMFKAILKSRNTRMDFEGSEGSPFLFLENFLVWDGAVIRDMEHGIWIENGTKIKYSRIEKGMLIEKKGYIQTWKAVFESEDKRQVTEPGK